MSNAFVKRIVALLLVGCALLGGFSANALEAGAAKVRIVLPEGTPLGGDAERRGRSALGEHDPLWVRCVYLDDGETHVYLISIDIHHIPSFLREQVVALAEHLADAESIFLTATHTGNGPGGMESRLPLRWTEGRYHPELVDMLAGLSLEAMQRAREAVQRATLGFGTTRQQVLSYNANESGGPVDEQIGVVRVDNADGQAIAILTSFAAMPRMVPRAQHYEFSADYPGAYYAALEELSDPGCVALFLPGAGAGQLPANPENQSGWAAVESIGRLLAIRTKEVANRMSFRDVKLQTFYREVPLPPTVSSALFPSSTILQALNLEGFLLVFVPAMPATEIGLELRRQMLELGYTAQCTVGVSNGYVMDIVPRSNFARATEAASRHHFGPGMESWLYGQVTGLVQGKDVDAKLSRGDGTAGATDDSSGGLSLRGDGFDRGYQRGERFSDQIRSRYEEVVVRSIRGGGVRPASGDWEYWPPALDPTSIAVPALAAQARPWLQGMDADTFSELEGAAVAAGLPFDAFWLLQNAVAIGSWGPASPWLQTPPSTLVAAVGERAGADNTVVGLNLDWPWKEVPLVVRSAPAVGHAFLEIGFEWYVGALVGVNDVGVAAAALELGPPGKDVEVGPPVHLIVRDVLQHATNYQTALTRLRTMAPRRNCRILLSARDTEGWKTAVISLGSALTERSVPDGLLFGVDLSREGVSDTTRDRYQGLERALVDERIVGPGELQRLLTTESPLGNGRNQVWNEDTHCSVVLLPEQRTIHVAFGDDSGRAGAYSTYSLEQGEPHE